jgi:hypothetical protein
MDATESVSQPPGALTLAGSSFVILPATPRDMLVVHNRMRAFAQAKATSPLDFAARHTHLPPAVFAVAIAEALKLGAGAPVPPPAEAVWDQYTTLDGVRWRLWYHVSRTLKEFTPEAAAALVTEDNLLDAAEALDRALNFKGIDPNAPAPATGSAS